MYISSKHHSENELYISGRVPFDYICSRLEEVAELWRSPQNDD